MVKQCVLDTVLVKCKLTVSTWNSNLDTRCFRESRIEFRGSSFEFRDARRIFRENDRKRFISRICNNRNKQYRASCGFLYSCKSTHVFQINVQIVSLELKCWIAIIQHSLHRKNNTRTNQPNSENAACEREFFISWLFPVPASSNFNLFAVFKLLERSYE